MSYASRVIRRLDLPRQAGRLLSHDRYWRADVVCEYFEACDQMIFERPRSGLEMARTGLELVRRLRDAPADLEARGIYTLAGAHRATGDLRSAVRRFAQARALCDRKLVSIRTSAALAEREAALHLARGSYPSALETIRYAILLHQAEGRCPIDPWVVEGVVLAQQGVVSGALESFQRVLLKANPTESPRAYVAALHNMTYLLTLHSVSPEDIGRARISLRQSRQLIRGYRDTPIRYCLDWIEAVIHRRLAELPRAYRLLQRARRGFRRLGLGHELAQATLELTVLLQAEGRAQEIPRLLRETVDIARQIGAEQTILAALLVAAEQDRTEQAVRLLERALLGRERAST